MRDFVSYTYKKKREQKNNINNGRMISIKTNNDHKSFVNIPFTYIQCRVSIGLLASIAFYCVYLDF